MFISFASVALVASTTASAAKPCTLSQWLDASEYCGHLGETVISCVDAGPTFYFMCSGGEEIVWTPGDPTERLKAEYDGYGTCLDTYKHEVSEVDSKEEDEVQPPDEDPTGDCIRDGERL